MGLDMYLNARKFTTPEYFNPEDFNRISSALDLSPEHMSDMPSIDININVAYWRKSNQIHQWFVNNVQDGKDDCDEYPVNHQTLITLKELCKLVLENKNLAKVHLPTQEGFFFGNTEYDEWYYSDIEDTIKQIDNVLEHYPLEKGWSLSYHSSW